MQAAGLSVYEEVYVSQLGEFKLEVTSSNTLFRVEQCANSLHTVGHTITAKRLQPAQEWLPAHMYVEMATAWLFYITKRNASQEQLTFSIALQNPALTAEPETGENLVAVGFGNGIRQLHIGTEYEEAMACRAAANDWMPTRLERVLRTEMGVNLTTITPHGLRTRLPLLEPGENFYFHYTLAENPYRKALESLGYMDISTWFAVEQTKAQLERSWQENRQ
ncbi:hypothetical protein LGH70_19345 [Hymenobacter sp. BT635]|uniref:Uncharacterized protein n=1 Tax=Hymenobacter nitidus TaxID=2880929 RepID=A0ABS8AKI9_9BACT|nr:hypothetical protein [Hymenobacter nitidus]MCB2379760.1 hypothetical protein [Hymenobacter nitidus]